MTWKHIFSFIWLCYASFSSGTECTTEYKPIKIFQISGNDSGEGSSNLSYNSDWEDLYNIPKILLDEPFIIKYYEYLSKDPSKFLTTPDEFFLIKGWALHRRNPLLDQEEFYDEISYNEALYHLIQITEIDYEQKKLVVSYDNKRPTYHNYVEAYNYHKSKPICNPLSKTTFIVKEKNPSISPTQLYNKRYDYFGDWEYLESNLTENHAHKNSYPPRNKTLKVAECYEKEYLVNLVQFPEDFTVYDSLEGIVEAQKKRSSCIIS